MNISLQFKSKIKFIKSFIESVLTVLSSLRLRERKGKREIGLSCAGQLGDIVDSSSMGIQ